MNTPKAKQLANQIFWEKANTLQTVTPFLYFWGKKVEYSLEKKEEYVGACIGLITSPIWEVVESILDCPEDLEVANAWDYQFDFGKVVLSFGDTGFGYGISPNIWNNNQEYTLLLEAFYKAKEYNSGIKQRALLKEMFEDE